MSEQFSKTKMEGKFLGGRPTAVHESVEDRIQWQVTLLLTYIMHDTSKRTAFDLIIIAALVFCYVRCCCYRVLLRPFELVTPVAIT